MMTEESKADAQRRRWMDYRRTEHLPSTSTEGFAQGGLGACVGDLDVRIMLLPSDPWQDVITLNDESLEWLMSERQSPYGGQSIAWGHESRATSRALVRYDRRQPDAPWSRYLALHRHGGLEFGSTRLSWARSGQRRTFALRPIVGIGFSLLAMQAEAVERWQVQAPYELTIALLNTEGAVLGDFAEGWLQPSMQIAAPTVSIEDHILLRWELEDGFSPEHMALDAGDRIEQAFGTVHRRHLANGGDFDGNFDPRFHT